MKSNRILTLIIVLIAVVAHTSVKLETNYYMFPIKPGQRNYLSGNFCELRSSHLHAGLDIKIGGVVGAPVHAAADGYVSRVKISWGSYGNCLYVQHPNGSTTVYAHLDQFNDVIGKYTKEAQYKHKNFAIDLYPEKGELAVKRGEIIGKAGNSGSSGGPHLHFEIRDNDQVPVDPLQYSFSEIVDRLPPYVRKVALVTLNKDARINGQFGRFEFAVRTNGRNYELADPVEVHGQIGVEIAAYDKADGVRNIYGVAKTEMLLDDKPVFAYAMDKVPFHEAKNIHIHTDYEERYRQDRTFYRLYVADGNTLSVYKTDKSQGKITINDNDPHIALVKLTDSYGNQSELTLPLKGNDNFDKTFKVRYFSKPYSTKDYHIRDNVLQLFAPTGQGPENLYEGKKARFYAHRMDFAQEPAYVVNDVAVYLWDLNKGIPDSIAVNQGMENLGIKMKVPSANAVSYYQPEMDVFFPKNALFDTLFLQTNYQRDAGREIFSIQEPNIPLKRSIEIKLKPKQFPADKTKSSVYALTSSGDLSYEGGSWEGNTISFRTGSFGDFIITSDTISPIVTPVSVNQSTLKFKIEDLLSGISSFDAFIDGQWVLMHYDYKRSLIWSDRLDTSKPLSGELKLIVKDNAGNETVFTSKIS